MRVEISAGWFEKFSGLLNYPLVSDNFSSGEISVLDQVSISI